MTSSIVNEVGEVGRFAFQGGRFANQALPFESLTELVAFEALLKEIARALYRQNNRVARKLPDHFEAGLGLCFRRVEGGSVVVPIEPIAVDIPGPAWAVGQSYLEQALALALEAANAANEDRRLPDGFPRSALSEVENLGRTLHPDEFFDISTPRGERCRYTTQTRQALLERAAEHWEDAVDTAGRVTEVSFRRREFTLDTITGARVVVAFDPDLERAVIDSLAHHADREVRIQGRGEFTPTGLRRVFALSSFRFSDAPRAESKPFWQAILERAAAVPAAELGVIPADGAENMDAYLYGRPR